jgi:hypothetical protein
MPMFLTQNSHFFFDEALFHLSAYINAENSTQWCSINPRQTSEAHLHSQKIGLCMPLLLHKQ